MMPIAGHAWDCREEPPIARDWRGWQAHKRQSAVSAVGDFLGYCREELGFAPAEIIAHPVDAAMVLAQTGGSVDGVPVRASDLTRCEPICLSGVYFVEVPRRG